MELVAWGANSHGQLGLGTTSEQEGDPVTVKDHPVLDGVEIVGGGGHSLLCDRDGRVFATGWNKAGQLGLGHTEAVTSFTMVDMIEKIISMATGWDFSLLLAECGEVFVAGSNSFGQLGMDDEKMKNVVKFVKVCGLSSIDLNTVFA